MLVDAFARGAAVELGQVLRVAGLVLEEDVDVLDRLDAELLLRDPSRSRGCPSASLERLVERPLGEGDAKEWCGRSRNEGSTLMAEIATEDARKSRRETGLMSGS
jgi:hypothetical protein